jgi:hypothetical protein
MALDISQAPGGNAFLIFRFERLGHGPQEVLRIRDDYGVMVLADRRFERKRPQLPKWINQAMLDSETKLGHGPQEVLRIRYSHISAKIGFAVQHCLVDPLGEFKSKDQEGISTWGLADIERHEAKRRTEEERMMRDFDLKGWAMVRKKFFAFDTAISVLRLVSLSNIAWYRKIKKAFPPGAWLISSAMRQRGGRRKSG